MVGSGVRAARGGASAQGRARLARVLLQADDVLFEKSGLLMTHLHITLLCVFNSFVFGAGVWAPRGSASAQGRARLARLLLGAQKHAWTNTSGSAHVANSA